MLAMTKVDSSNVRAVAYFLDPPLLLVQYRDGSLYARPGVSEKEYADLMAAESKGKFLHALRGRAVFIGEGEGAIPKPMSVEDMRRVAKTKPDINCDFTVL